MEKQRQKDHEAAARVWAEKHTEAMRNRQALLEQRAEEARRFDISFDHCSMHCLISKRELNEERVRARREAAEKQASRTKRLEQVASPMKVRAHKTWRYVKLLQKRPPPSPARAPPKSPARALPPKSPAVVKSAVARAPMTKPIGN